MKRFFAAVLSLALPLSLAIADDAPAAKKPDAKTATATADASDTTTNKPDIKQLMQDPLFTNSVGMVMVKISPTLWASKYLVTQDVYQKVTGGNPSQFQGDRNPVDSLSWDDAKSFCTSLDSAEKKEEMLPDGFGYSLPTQAQWESFAAGAPLSDAVTSQGGKRNGSAPVGSLGANSQGLYDVRGNVWQWCADPDDKPYRVLRGAAWNTWIEINLRPEFRWYSDGPADKKNTFGFRVVLQSSGG
jgi:formylglycine-generating enzyme required for sulfatase activity